MKKLLGILVLGLLIFINQSKAELIELDKCFRVHPGWWNYAKVNTSEEFPKKEI